MAERIDLDLTPLRGRLGVSNCTISLWQYGHHRPRWRFLRPIADILGVSLAEVVYALWNERLGDPCPCGCDGIKVLPDKFASSRQLAIEITCECGAKRIRKRHPDGFYHMQLCP